MKQLLFLLVIITTLNSCNESDESVNPDLSGRYNLIEPVHPLSGEDRPNYQNPAFDVVFTIQGSTFTEVDVVLNGRPTDNETGRISGKNIVFEAEGVIITMQGVSKDDQTLKATGLEFTTSDQTKTYGPLQIDSL